jgi:hypothetical protein
MEYGYYDYVPLNVEEILSRVSQEEIFSIVLQPVFDEFIISPLRNNDSSAGCYFLWYNDKLYFVDFGYSNMPLDCFGFIGAYYGIRYIETLKMVNEHFKLGLGYSSNSVKPVTITRKQTEKIPKKNTQILFQPREYTVEDGKYWSMYKIKKSQLIQDHVYAVRWYKVIQNQKETVIRPRKPSYAIYEFKPRVKIYCPTTKIYRDKWITNCNRNDIGNINNISSYGTNLLITKSYKDCRVLRNIGKKDVIWFQNEGMLPDISKITMLCKRFQTISILFDNDEAGIKALERVASVFNSYYPGKADKFVIPDFNDPAEMVKKVGEKPLINFLEANNIL